MTRTWPSLLTMTLSGLKSRWTSSLSCAAASPRPAAMYTFSVSCQVRVCDCVQKPAVWPSTNSIAMKTFSSNGPTS